VFAVFIGKAERWRKFFKGR